MTNVKVYISLQKAGAGERWDKEEDRRRRRTRGREKRRKCHAFH